MLFSEEEIEHLFRRPKLILPALHESSGSPAPVHMNVVQKLEVPIPKRNRPPSEEIKCPARTDMQPETPGPKHTRPPRLTSEEIRKRKRDGAAAYRKRQTDRITELKLLLYGDENVSLPVFIEAPVVRNLCRQARNVVYSSLSRKRKSKTLEFLENELALKRGA